MIKFLLTAAMILVSLFSIFPITMSEYHFISDFQKDNPFWKTGSLIKSDVVEWVCHENAGFKKTTEIKRLRPDKTCTEISQLNENGLKSMSEIFVYYPVIDKDGSQTGDILKESMILDESGNCLARCSYFLKSNSIKNKYVFQYFIDSATGTESKDYLYEIVYKYNQNGEIVEESVENYYKISMIHDDKGLLIEQKTLFSETQTEYTSNYKYDNNNNLKTELFYKNGELQSTINYSFKLEAGKITEKKSIKYTGKKLIETSVF